MVRELFATGRDGTRIYVRIRDEHAPGDEATVPGMPGERLTAVLCDGIACDGFIWKYLWDDLARMVRVAHWNYRGHGRSGLPVDPAAIELVDHARDLAGVREAIDTGRDSASASPSVGAGRDGATAGDPSTSAAPVILFGHSMGCQVVLEHLRMHRKGVRGLVLICGASGRITHSFKGTDVLAQLLPRLIERVEAHPQLARAIWSRVPAPVALQVALLSGEVDKHSITPEDLLPYMRHMVDIDVPMFLRMLRSAGEHSAADLLPQIDVPALVIGGDRDTFTPPRYAEEMAAALPRGELMMVSGATHVVPLERKEMVRERVERFLREKVLVAASTPAGVQAGGGAHGE